MFRIDPVDRLSMTSTSCPASSSASARWDPMKPAPPVINALTTPVPFRRRCRQTHELLQPPNPPLSSRAQDGAAEREPDPLLHRLPANRLLPPRQMRAVEVWAPDSARGFRCLRTAGEPEAAIASS